MKDVCYKFAVLYVANVFQPNLILIHTTALKISETNKMIKFVFVMVMTLLLK